MPAWPSASAITSRAAPMASKPPMRMALPTTSPSRSTTTLIVFAPMSIPAVIIVCSLYSRNATELTTPSRVRRV
jgi:hypothetical protein